MALGILDRLFGRPGPSVPGLSGADLSALKTFLSGLDRAKKGAGAAAYDYVANDGDSSILQYLAGAAQQVQVSITAQGQFLIPVNAFVLHPQSPAAPKHVFQQLEGWNAGVYMRLGELMAAAVGPASSMSYIPGTAACPYFFRVLIYVIVRGQDTAQLACSLDGARCLELLALAGADQAALVDVLFAGMELGRPGRPAQLKLLTMRGLPEALAAAPDRTLFGVRALDVNERSSFWEFLGRTGLASRPEFFEALLTALGTGGKQETKAVLAALATCPESMLCERAAQLLASKHADERRMAVMALVALGTPAARELLERHLPNETSRALRQTIEEAMRPLPTESQAAPAAALAGPGYMSIDNEWIAIPPMAALPPDTPLPAGFADELRAIVNDCNRLARVYFDEYRQRFSRASDEERRRMWGPKTYEEPFSAAAIPELVDILAGKIAPKAATTPARGLVAGYAREYRDASAQYHMRLESLLSDPGLTLHHHVRMTAMLEAPRVLLQVHQTTIAARKLAKLVIAGGDFRPAFAVGATVGWTPAAALAEVLRDTWGRIYRQVFATSRKALWTLVAGELELIDQALGIAPAPLGSSYQVICALDLLATLPAPPLRHLPALLDLAIGGAKEHKAAARAILASARSVTALITPLLESREQARRLGAAEWLRQRRDRAAVPALRAALAKEKTDAVCATILATLVSLGDDVSDWFSEQRLVAEASAGLAKTKTKVGECVLLDHIPPLTWADSRAVPAEVARWWVVLAHKLKSARGSPMLNLALDRLEKGCAERLALFVISSFVAHDTRTASEAEANAFAEANVDQAFQLASRWSPGMTRERMFAQLKQQKLGEYLQSANEHRGILALARRAPAGEAVNIAKAFFRDHYARTHQCKALLDCLANNASPVALQFVLGISMRYRTAGVQKHAADLINEIAADRGWTRDELADRTAPTGGLDETGTLQLPVGDRAYVASLDADLKIVLRNPDGKVVQGLPANDETVEAAKKALSTLKKELKQTQAQQTARLYEAMCAERTWSPADIDELLFRHPVIGRLCSRLVFAGLDEHGKPVATFRPLGDGSFTDVADKPVDLTGFSGVRVAHRVLLDEAQASAWQQHLADYEISPLFEQLARPVATLEPELADATAIKDREGYVIDTFALRGAATKLGYQRGPAGDGGVFTTYRKSFPAAQCAAVIEFTGSPLPEINGLCALLDMHFLPEGDRLSHGIGRMALSAVPPVLLSEVRNDFSTVAAAATGFDPDWRKKVEW
jgi:hypothetical protein